MKKNQKSENAKMDSHAGENSSTQIPAINTVFHEGKTYYCHPIYHNYGCSTDGYIINRKRLVPSKGNLQPNGYLNIGVYNQNGRKKILFSSIYLGINKPTNYSRWISNTPYQ